jgi:hypothetical protein
MLALGRGMGASKDAGDERAPAADDTDDDTDDDRWVAPAPLELADGTKVVVKEKNRLLEVRDRHARLMWAHFIDPDEERAMRRAIPFGPFIALAALEFLFFGERLVDAYLSLFM